MHPHSQLVVVPKQINLDSLSLEPVNNMVEETAALVTFCPDFSQWPYETWIAPKELVGKFSDIPSKLTAELAAALRKTLQCLRAVYDATPIFHDAVPFGYNYYLSHGSPWFIRIIPRFVHRAGFELGTGLNVNVIDPTDAAEGLRKIR